MESYQTSLHRLHHLATQMGLKLNPDAASVEKVVSLMAKIIDAVSESICPCKQEHKPAVTGADITCPFPTLNSEIGVAGTCHCRLFMSV
jgi:ferredoxin-thioredoxin reductase catalytic subunit